LKRSSKNLRRFKNHQVLHQPVVKNVNAASRSYPDLRVNAMSAIAPPIAESVAWKRPVTLSQKSGLTILTSLRRNQSGHPPSQRHATVTWAIFATSASWARSSV